MACPDYNPTTPVDGLAVESLAPAFDEHFGTSPRGTCPRMATSYRHSQMNQIGRVNSSSHMPAGHERAVSNLYVGIHPMDVQIQRHAAAQFLHGKNYFEKQRELF